MNTAGKYTTVCSPGLYSRFQRFKIRHLTTTIASDHCWWWRPCRFRNPATSACGFSSLKRYWILSISICSMMLTPLHSRLVALASGILKDMYDSEDSKDRWIASPWRPYFALSPSIIWELPDLHETVALMNPFKICWHLDRTSFDESFRELGRGYTNFVSMAHSPNAEVWHIMWRSTHHWSSFLSLTILDPEKEANDNASPSDYTVDAINHNNRLGASYGTWDWWSVQIRTQFFGWESDKFWLAFKWHCYLQRIWRPPRDWNGQFRWKCGKKISVHTLTKREETMSPNDR